MKLDLKNLLENNNTTNRRIKMYHLILWLSLILTSVFAMVNNEIYLSMSLFLIFAVNVAYNFSKYYYTKANSIEQANDNFYKDYPNSLFSQVDETIIIANK